MLIPKNVHWMTSLQSTVGAIILTLLLGCISAYYLYNRGDLAEKLRLIERATTMGLLISRDDLAQLDGTPDDLRNPYYVRLKKQLMDVRATNSDLRFAYLLGRNESDQLFFYMDSEPATSTDYSPPGQVYEEAPHLMRQVFEDGVSRYELYDDRWGDWASGYSAIKDESGKIRAVLGIDTAGKEYEISMLTYASVPLLLSLIVAIFIGVLYVIRRRERHYIDRKSEFLTVASHEIRTPLTGIRWTLETLLKQKPRPFDPTVEKTLSLVYESAGKLLTRINGLLAAIRLENTTEIRLKHEVIALRAFIESLCGELGLSAKERGVTFDIDQSLLRDIIIIADTDYMRHIFFNLLSNALKYTDPRTSIVIGYEMQGTNHVISIRDHGRGVSKEDQGKIFGGYHRSVQALFSDVPGTGLGLFLVQQSVKLLNGKVWLESEKDRGTTFFVSLPT